ncbi:hypothetical protein [Streptomyces chiangmaiensis]|uniref:Uncharacterized protein n=1 Tax=Streptomyces chiangmaiensis TaxID=766497 RepID=A0ABU7FXH0_9ACTN|nr:hypothetical protein [Streptomyces chiangmaiensis]MED7828645.1 hypothetical protein [Streptomyces chiangmaiensis]
MHVKRPWAGTVTVTAEATSPTTDTKRTRITCHNNGHDTHHHTCHR